MRCAASCTAHFMVSMWLDPRLHDDHPMAGSAGALRRQRLLPGNAEKM